MERRDALKLMGIGVLPFLLSDKINAFSHLFETSLKSSDFGKFTWGVSTAAAQIEGAWNEDGKGPSIWDTFSARHGKIKDGSTPQVSCDYYHRFEEDTTLIKQLNFQAHRFSIAWPRLMPIGMGQVNQKGIDFYNKVIDSCLKNNIEPWVTLYHWDLPQALQDRGGWTNRDIVGWFSDYTSLCAKSFGDRVKNWIVLNEPMGFVGLGYGTGYHAPGLSGLKNFLPAIHHATLCQAEGGRVLKNLLNNAKIGTAFSCSPVDAYYDSPRDEAAAKRIDALMNRLFVEPAVGLGYPVADLHFLKRIEKYMQQGDENKMKFDFDFFGIQNYFRIVADFSILNPILWANQKKPGTSKAQRTEMDWEIYPEGMYRSIRQFSKYPVKELVITENGAAFKDFNANGQINDAERKHFFENYLKAVLKAKNEGANVTGYFAWTLLDNFEWVEGYRPKFGLVNVDFTTQQRLIKDSGKWFSEFLKQ